MPLLWSFISAPAVEGLVLSVLSIIRGCCWKTGWVSLSGHFPFICPAAFRLRNHLVLQNTYLYNSSFLEYLLVHLLGWMIKLVPNFCGSQNATCPQTSSINIPWEHVKNAKSGAPPEMDWSRNSGGWAQQTLQVLLMMHGACCLRTAVLSYIVTLPLSKLH